MARRATSMSIVLAAVLAFAAPASALAPPPEQLPDGDTRPEIIAAELVAPQPHNDLLEADLRIEAIDNHGIARYEYRWSSPNPGEAHTTAVDRPTVSYASVLPEALAGLEVRAVDLHGWESDWHRVWSGFTPAVPAIIVAGDSIASGYQRQWFTGDATCRDRDYSYGRTIRDAVAAALPPAWSPTYVNLAFPGAGVRSVIEGGSDSCSDARPSQVEDIVHLSDPATWNVVVMTAGINSTNWVDVVKELTADTAFSLTESGDRLACEHAVLERWNLEAQRDHITDGAASITDAIETQTNAAVFWTSYFMIDGTTIAPGWSPVGPECAAEMDYALTELHDAILAGLDDDVTWVPVDHLVISTQTWAGWPHPNPDGHRAIGLAVAEAIVG